MNDDVTPVEQLEEAGAWPFVTHRVWRRLGEVYRQWHARHHRKRLAPPETLHVRRLPSLLLRGLWLPGKLNWWIGVIFAIGASLFAVGCVLSLWPALAGSLSIGVLQIGAIYFAGSIPFTTAAYLQLFQAANAGEFGQGKPLRTKLFAWRPHDPGWLSCLSQFIGTILFNFNTFDSMWPGLSWFWQEYLVWVPNVVGSILFLFSGYLAFIEFCHAYFAWRPDNLSWWIVTINLLGCIGFMISAVYAFVPTSGITLAAETIATAFTLQGAICFFVGAVLMLPETAEEAGEELPSA
ncbi:hypothetical protein [Blastopirellula retiformator]|uniref:YrhK domain-containing protein n=1 Tax=Blastopirellula retiformator TaxID=2527970 RepID=A0A5C5VIP6_9BACT|nr:hypothetical protein [Blastopirellula retiformator]TWT38476.1 hypothetical protein Enr8_01680 [Blastopirellula retiformator]